ncbi:M56 family metallopeptidase [Aureibacter tunicatorum]|uniref:TonB family protein n=1 Tax=Aureibacter tunicatorum TaxID=866807 RepID=A0AAE4BQS8_9BACT|nr:M56 family metallopeptidase [Aureibacter tunicatorum]MDR6237055.1 TonB family protein [Aureibacter tunicatorum]BDD06047.1 cell envelope biogenesis protein TonB [Aureibacter tunicatorum]
MDITYITTLSLVLAFGLGLYRVALYHLPSFKYNRFFLLSTLLISVFAPIIDLSIFVKTSDINQASIFLNEISINSNNVIKNLNSLQLLQIDYLKLIYWGVIALLFIRLGIQIFKIINLNKINNSSLILHENKKYRLVKLNDDSETFSFLNRIYLSQKDQNLGDREKRNIINHELAHIQQFHSFDILFIELLVIIFWFHPLVWLAKKYIAQNHEYLADSNVLNKHSESFNNYSQLLVNRIFANNHIPIGSHFNKSLTLNRIKMLKKNSKPRSYKFFWTLPCLLLVFGTVCCNNAKEGDDITEINSASAEGNLSSINNSEVYSQVDVNPEFPGGLKAFYTQVSKVITYPQDAKEAKIEGRVFIEFIISKDGNIESPTIIKGVEESLDQEALHAFNTINTKWTPGQIDGKKVNVKMVLPIIFKLN